MDDYSKEIADLRAQIEAMQQEEEADPKELKELQMQLDVLGAIYSRALELYDRGRDDLPSRRALAMRGYGDWTLDNVYAYVYEAAVDEPTSGHHAFLGVIRETDFGHRLVESAATADSNLD
jgi:hypothetical protein